MTPKQEQGDRLSQELEREFPQAWRPEKEGDQIVGYLIRVETGSTPYGPAPVVIVRGEDGAEHAIWLFSEAVKTGFRRAAPQPGEKIGIRYLGEQEVKHPQPGRKNTYHNFRVVVDRPVEESVINWDSTLSESGDVVADDEDAPF